MPKKDVFPNHIDELCEELKPLLKAELDAGNEVTETWKGDWPIEDCLYILLAKPFQKMPDPLPEGLRISQMGELHYWGDEIICDRNNHVLASSRPG